jgi:phosphatidylserine/phosphatidylglycerophosphate/cardiolipin synthase-like enzyme
LDKKKKRSVAQYQYRSICRGKHSIFEQLNKANIPIKEYIGFYSLRNWGRVKSTVTSPTSSSIRDDSTINVAMMNPVVEPKQPRKRTITKKRSKSRYSTGSNVSRSGSGNSDDAFSSNQDDFVDSKMEFVTEQVYIHSKLMIVDDKTVVCGSGNLKTSFRMCFMDNLY